MTILYYFKSRPFDFHDPGYAPDRPIKGHQEQQVEIASEIKEAFVSEKLVAKKSHVENRINNLERELRTEMERFNDSQRAIRLQAIIIDAEQKLAEIEEEITDEFFLLVLIQ